MRALKLWLHHSNWDADSTRLRYSAGVSSLLSCIPVSCIHEFLQSSDGGSSRWRDAATFPPHLQNLKDQIKANFLDRRQILSSMPNTGGISDLAGTRGIRCPANEPKRSASALSLRRSSVREMSTYLDASIGGVQMRWLGYGVVVHGYESFALDLYLGYTGKV